MIKINIIKSTKKIWKYSKKKKNERIKELKKIT